MRLPIDTHALLWWASGSPKLSTHAANLIADSTNELLLSAAVVWELSIKAALGRLTLVGGTPAQFILRLTTSLAMIPLSIKIDHALAVYNLPLHHQDPFDCILIAQAQIENVPLITADSVIPQYGIPTEW
jgi:PIN domain nuclease of toxin-antitoxin system